ncbi:hypothetical protein C8J56DRAFT_892413 [Mycena floridula]|nr:hypothetical protein C8J56DRAFT_892413 [Mycena floridula]
MARPVKYHTEAEKRAAQRARQRAYYQRTKKNTCGLELRRKRRLRYNQDKLQHQSKANAHASDNMSFSSPEESNALASRRYLMSIHQADRKLRQLLHGPSAEYLERLVLRCSRQAEDSKAVKLVQDRLDSVQAIIDHAEDARAGLLKLLGPYSTDFRTADSIVHGIRQFIRELVDIGSYCMSGIEELGGAYEQSSLLYQS